MVRLTYKDYNIISKKADSLDPKEYKTEEQYCVGKEFDVNGRKIRVIDDFAQRKEYL